MTTHAGSCLCGSVRFEITGDFECFYLCHCRYCRKDTGSAHAANLFTSAASLRWLSGQARIRQFILPATRHSRSFCLECGSALPDVQDGGSRLVVPAGSLDSDIALRPAAHIFASRRASWDRALEEIPAVAGFPV